MLLSVYMNQIIESAKTLESLSNSHSGVYSLSDLKSFFQFSDKMKLHRMLNSLEQNNVLSRFTRGLYVTPSFDLEVASQRLCAQSYISFGRILAKNMIIGSIPEKTVMAVKIGKNRRYQGTQGEIVHLGISSDLFFGFVTQNGICYADKEKAFLDTLYFYQKGYKFSFNIYQDINFDLLDNRKLKTYLACYKNPKFITFVKGLIDARN